MSAGHHPGAVRRPIGLVHDHALREQAREGLVEAGMAGLLHGAGEEARIEQVQDRVLDAADILVDRQPVIDGPAVGRPVGQPRIGEAGEIPGRIDEGVHRVGLAPAAFRRSCGQATCFQVGCRSSGLPGTSKETSSGSTTGRSSLGHRHDAAGVAVDDRDRAAPVALARDAPVAQAEIHLALRHRPVAAGLGFQAAGDLVLGGLDAHAVEEARVDHPAVAVIGGVGDRRRSPDPCRAGRRRACCRGRSG